MPQKTNPFQIRAAGEDKAEVLIYGDIGQNWYGDGVDAKNFVTELQQLDVSNIDVRINSYGGSVSDGIAIHNALRRHAANVTVIIEGVAVSIASLIAMAGDTVKMGDNSLFMVHAPWSYAAGNSKELREFADVLDIYAEAMAASYMRKTGKTRDEIMQLLTDGVDHYYLASEAMAEGFVDVVTADAAEAIAASGFKNSRFAQNAPGLLPGASAIKSQSDHVLNLKINVDTTGLDEATQLAAKVAATHQEETTMPDKVKDKATETQVTTDEQVVAAATEQVKAAERQRKADIRAAFSPFQNRDGVRALLDACIDDDTVTPAAASDKLLAQLGKGAESLGGDPRIESGEDERDKRTNAATDALLVRAGVAHMRGNGITPAAIDLSGNPFRGASLMDMARMSLRSAGKNPDGMDKREVVAQAFQTTSDFPILLENTIHKVLMTAYLTANDTWSRFCKIGSVSDFRAHNRYRVGSIGNLDSLTEHGAFKTKQIPDGEKGSITASTKGNIIAITREAIINDDLQALTDLAAMLGRAFKRTIEAAVYSLLGENAGLGPTMLDTFTLFHANHANIGTAAAISMAAIDADRVFMAQQTDVGGNDYLDLRPAKLLVPVSLGGTARSINDAQYDPDTANKLQKPNIVNGLFDDIIDTPRLTGTRRYLFADPNEAPVIEVAFLDGMQEPYIETKDGWSVDGAELKVRGDFGVAAIDYRGAVTNAGA